MSPLSLLILPYQQAIEKAISDYFSTPWRSADRLRQACLYALQTGGKRLRPVIVLMMGKALRSEFDLMRPALSLEFCHTASLLADDLPCMDNDDFRRSQPTTHRAFDEATALLASYGLIAEGYTCLTRAAKELSNSGVSYASHSEAIALAAIENISFNSGFQGATGGQYLDLFPAALNAKTVEEALAKKTAALFEAAFVCGWLFGGGSSLQLQQVKTLAYHFGMAFQIADDLVDQRSDQAANRSVNLASACGVACAKETLLSELEQFDRFITALSLEGSELHQLGDQLLAMGGTDHAVA